MKNLLASTALVAMAATMGIADDHDMAPFAAKPMGKVLYTSDLVGARLYVSESGDGMLEERVDWDDVGEIHDIVVSHDGSAQHVLTDIGGFLGIGEKRVAVSMDALEIVSDGEDPTDYFVVMRGSRDVLESAPEYEYDVTMAHMDDDKTLTQASPMERREMLVAPDIKRDGYEMAKLDSLTTEEVTGTRVYDSRDEWIGEVNSLILDDSGKITEAVIDVGGFLGIGEKQVALTMKELNIQRGNGDLRIYVDATQEALEKMPEWNG